MTLSTSRRMADSQVQQKNLLQKIRKGAMDLTGDKIRKLMALRLGDIKSYHGQEMVQQRMDKSVFLYYTHKKRTV